MQSRRSSAVLRCEQRVGSSHGWIESCSCKLRRIKIRYLKLPKINAFYHTRLTRGFPCVTLYVNSEEALQIYCIIIAVIKILYIFWEKNLVGVQLNQGINAYNFTKIALHCGCVPGTSKFSGQLKLVSLNQLS